MEIKDLIIFLVIFITIMWLQHNDDKKFNKPKREALYDIIKLPLFVCLIIFVIKDFQANIYDKFFMSNKPVISSYSDSINDIYVGLPDF